MLESVLRAVFGGDALQTIIAEARKDRPLNDFFNARISLAGVGQRVDDIDSYWTSSGLTIPTGYRHLSVYSRKAFSYPSLAVYTTLVTLAANLRAGFGVEVGGGVRLPMAYFWEYDTEANLAFGSIGEGVNYLDITTLLPGDYDTADHLYHVKVNKCNCELFIDDILVAIGLFGLKEAIPDWENNPPYAIGSRKTGLLAASQPAIVEIDNTGATLTLPLDITDNNFVAADGDPLPPRQYALYNENTATKWNGQAIAAGTITSHPVPVWGYPNKTLHFQANGAGSLDMEFYVGGAWRVAETIAILANTLMVRVIDSEQPIIRFVFDPDAYPTTVNAAEVHLS